MSQKTRKLRYSVLIGMVFALLAGLMGVQPANAVGSDPTGTPVELVGASQPDVFRENGTTAQPAADLELAVDGIGDLALENGERLIVEVSDGLAKNCANATGQFIGFAALPTVTVSEGSNVTVSSELQRSTALNKLRADGSQCAAPFTPATFDQLVITVTSAPAPFGTAATISISDINYLVGSQAGTGFATILWAADAASDGGLDATVTPSGANDGDSSPTVHDVGPQGAEPAGTDGEPTGGLSGGGISNAYITNLSASTPDPAAIRPGQDIPVGDIVLTETDFAAAHPSDVTPPGDPTVTGLCIQLIDQIVDFTDAGTASSDGDTVGTPTIEGSNDIIRIPVSVGASPKKSTITLSGVLVDTRSGEFGPQRIHVYQCNDTPSHMPTTNLTNNPAFNSAVTEYTNTPRLLLVVVNAERYAGSNRNDTARVIADRDFPCVDDKFGDIQGDQVFAIIARNDDFADALTASYISGQVYAPILLVNTHGPIPQETLDALQRLAVTDVIIMGGNVAVGDDVAAALDALTSFNCAGAARRTPEDLIRTINIQRVQGSNRFGTAKAAALFTFGGNTIGFLGRVNDDLEDENEGNLLRTAIVANGRNFPDAMVGGPIAFQGINDREFTGSERCQFQPAGTCDGYPILLSDAGAAALPVETQSLITERNIEQVIIIGGTAAVPASIQTALEAQGIRVIRLGGDNRQLTAIAVAKFEISILDFGRINSDQSFGHVALARGDFFTDALALGPMAGNDPNNTNITSLIESPGLEPILLTVNPDTIGPDTAAFLAALAADYTGPDGAEGPDDLFGLSAFWIDIAGGTVAVSNAAQEEALAALIGGV